MDALSGQSRAIFFVGYPSFDAWQKDMDATMKNSSLSAALDSAAVADGALLEAYETSVYTYREDLSLRGPVDIPHMRYMEIAIYNVRPGHEKDFEELVKMYMAALQKVPDAHWATFEKMYGAQPAGSRFIAVTPMKSLAEVDQEMIDGSGFGKVDERGRVEEDERPLRGLHRVLPIESRRLQSQDELRAGLGPRRSLFWNQK